MLTTKRLVIQRLDHERPDLNEDHWAAGSCDLWLAFEKDHPRIAATCLCQGGDGCVIWIESYDEGAGYGFELAKALLDHYGALYPQTNNAPKFWAAVERLRTKPDLRVAN